MITYVLVEEKYELNGKEHLSYGISALKDIHEGDGNAVISSIHHITPKKDKLSVLIALCNRFNLEPIHLNDVVEDFLSNVN